jgi:hypothetical protein
VTREIKLRYLLIGLCLGFFLFALLYPVSADRNSDLEVRALELDVARNTEKIAEIRQDIQAIKAWINASDKQKVMDAEEYGGVKTTVVSHERLVWLGVAQAFALTLLLVELAMRRLKRN